MKKSNQTSNLIANGSPFDVQRTDRTVNYMKPLKVLHEAQNNGL